MALLDCIIEGGDVIDGTGAPRIRANVAIKDGRIAAIGTIGEPAAKRIDASGRVITPGFIDLHTHYDAQVMWDRNVTPSSLHGVTSVIAGNCGFGIAPITESSQDYVTHMLACVEGMPYESLKGTLEYRWRSFADWLGELDGALAINTGYMVGHTTIRRAAMGDDWRKPADAGCIRQMAAEVNAAIEAGALGFSSSWGENHGDHLGGPVPSRFADHDELVALARVLQRHPGTMLGFTPSVMPRFPERTMEVMADMAATSGRPLLWNVLQVGAGLTRADIDARLAASDLAAARGGRVLGLTVPVVTRFRLNLRSTIAYNFIPSWREFLARPAREKTAMLAKRSVRKDLEKALQGQPDRIQLRFAEMTVASVANSAMSQFDGRRLGDIASERGCSPLEAFFDISLEDDLRACFETVNVGDDSESWLTRSALWRDPRLLVGGSDAGAHLDMLDAFAYFTDFVGPSVRNRKLLSLEEAVHRITEQPARVCGLRERGRVEAGWHADLVILDPDTVAPGKVRLIEDMPGGGSRLYAGAIGIDHVLVGGVEIISQGNLTGATPGTVLRSGRDTA